MVAQKDNNRNSYTKLIKKIKKKERMNENTRPQANVLASLNEEISCE